METNKRVETTVVTGRSGVEIRGMEPLTAVVTVKSGVNVIRSTQKAGAGRQLAVYSRRAP